MSLWIEKKNKAANPNSKLQALGVRLVLPIVKFIISIYKKIVVVSLFPRRIVCRFISF